MEAIKNELITVISNNIEGKIKGLNNQIESIRDSMKNETKSSAGDKYETAREMAQLEIDKLSKQLAQQRKMLSIFSSLDFSCKSSISNGSLVITDKAKYFLSASIGKLSIENHDVFCISVVAPIAQSMLSLKKEDSFTFNGLSQTIKDIY